MPLQHRVIFTAVEMTFSVDKIFFILPQNIDCGCMLETPH